MMENNSLTGNSKSMGWKYLLLAFATFAGILLEFAASGLDYLIFKDYLGFEDPKWRMILHWIITYFLWIGVAILLIRFAKAKLGFDIFIKGEKMKLWQWGTAVFAIVLSVVLSYLACNMNFKVVIEFNALGPIGFIFQYIYYIIEVALFLLIIVFGQKAFESWTKKSAIPWGGIICGLTWGIVHIISRGVFDPFNGIAGTIYGFMFGATYLLVNRDIRKAWVVLFLMFVL